MACDNCGYERRKRSWLYYFCCGPDEQEYYDAKLEQEPYQGRSRAYVQNSSAMPQMRCGYEPEVPMEPGRTTRFDYVSDRFEPPQREYYDSGYQPPLDNNYSSNYSSTKVFVNSAHNPCQKRTFTTSSGNLSSHHYNSSHVTESKVRFDAPKGGFKSSYPDQSYSGNVIRY